MKKTSLILVPVLTLAAAAAQAQTTAPAPAPAATEAKSDWAFTGNAGVYSEYRFRGISQTNKKPAFQGGFDVGHSSGFYAGNWNSNIDSGFFNGANLEMDFYGGYKMPAGPVTLDFGGLYYYYPGSGAGGTFKVDHTEVYIGATFGPASIKYFHGVSDFFGIDDSKNSYYVDGSITWDLGNGIGLIGHIGYQKVKGNARFFEIGSATLQDSLVDWKLGATYDLSGFLLTAAYIDTNRNLTGGTAALTGRNISSGTVVVSVSKTF